VTLFTKVQKSQLENEPAAPPDIRTVAVGEISSATALKGKFDLAAFAEGLRISIMKDLRESTPLKLVERQRLDVLKSEIGMSSDEAIMDRRYAVQLGRLCGAQSYVFGHIQGVGDEISLTLRWVETSTSEVHSIKEWTAEVKSSRDLYELKRKVMVEMMVPEIEARLSGADVKKKVEQHLGGKPMRDTYLQAVLKAGAAVLAQKRGDDAAAALLWAEAARLDPDQQVAAAAVRAGVLNATLAIQNAKRHG
jgi:hypothetical protein